MTKFTIEISYSQVAVFDPNLKDPFNDWTDEHVAQGFAWRPGSVSFGTVEPAGPMTVNAIRTTDFDATSSPAVRIIAVPFTVPQSGSVEIASIANSAVVQMSPGKYELVFEHGRDAAGAMWANFHFRPVAAPVDARIIRADAELTPPTHLVMAARPA